MDTTKEFTHISTCAGYGGIDLGLRRVIENIRTIAYVEIEAFAVANLVAKIEEGELDAAPIWTNLKTFDAKPFLGKVDLLSGGISCQPFSSASNWKGPVSHTACDGKSFYNIRPSGQRFGAKLEDAIALVEKVRWRTPSAQEPGVSAERLTGGLGGRAYDKITGRNAQIGLTQQVQLASWATPTARDWVGANSITSLVRRDGKSRMDSLPNQVIHGQQDPTNSSINGSLQESEPKKANGHLNPRWVETLMGLPIGWVNPMSTQIFVIEQTNSECSETE